jgi:hypothetical protein
MRRPSIAAGLKALRPMMRGRVSPARHVRRAARPTSPAYKSGSGQLQRMPTPYAAFLCDGTASMGMGECRDDSRAVMSMPNSQLQSRSRLSSTRRKVSNGPGWQEFAGPFCGPSKSGGGLWSKWPPTQQVCRRNIGSRRLRQIARANEAGLGRKFLALSCRDWGFGGTCCGPDGASFFSAVRPRPGTRRTHRFQGGALRPAIDASATPTLRDVIAEFSQSHSSIVLASRSFSARRQSTRKTKGHRARDGPVFVERRRLSRALQQRCAWKS